MGLLGPVCVWGTDGKTTTLRGHAAHLLALLALHPDRALSVDEIAGRLWPAGAPPTARTALQGHVSRLRRLLPAGGPVRIETVPGGYALRRADHGDGPSVAIDLDETRALVDAAAAARAAGQPGDAAVDLGTALALWRGPALADLRDEVPALAAEAATLDDERRAAEDALADALTAAGDLDRALALLGRLVNDEPLRERRWALLMTALTRAGRQTDALRAYRQAAALLADRTGLEPGHELRRLETAILLQDPTLDAARWQPAPGSRPAPLAPLVGPRRRARRRWPPVWRATGGQRRGARRRGEDGPGGGRRCGRRRPLPRRGGRGEPGRGRRRRRGDRAGGRRRGTRRRGRRSAGPGRRAGGADARR